MIIPLINKLLDLFSKHYLQIIKGRKNVRYGNRNEEMEDIMILLKSLAVELEIPIIIFTQIHRTI